MARSVKQRAAQRKAALASARKRRKRGKYQRKITKNNRRIRNIETGLKRDFAPGSPTHGSGLHHSVQRLHGKRLAQNRRYAAKVKKWS